MERSEPLAGASRRPSTVPDIDPQAGSDQGIRQHHTQVSPVEQPQVGCRIANLSGEPDDGRFRC
jgi:hypothetical protein